MSKKYYSKRAARFAFLSGLYVESHYSNVSWDFEGIQALWAAKPHGANVTRREIRLFNYRERCRRSVYYLIKK